MVNHDINVFGGISKRKDHSQRFDQSRNILDKTIIITFHGVWNELKNDNIGARPTRYCPAHQMVMNKFVPFLVSTFLMIEDNNDSNENGIWPNLTDGRKEFNEKFDDREYDYNTIVDYKSQVVSSNEIKSQEESQVEPKVYGAAAIGALDRLDTALLQEESSTIGDASVSDSDHKQNEIEVYEANSKGNKEKMS